MFGAQSLQNATANGDTRTISFHHIHLNEDTTITYKVDGRYVPDALEKINHALRDWRTGQPTTMDPHLIDALWEVYRAVGAQDPIQVIGGFRSPGTNAMLRRRSSGVARHSQHMNGKAIDFFIPGVPLEAIREAGLRLQRGGVGFYPTSGSPFVHMDTGSVRHWPRIPEAQLARILAKGPLTQVASRTPAARATVVAVAPRNGGADDQIVETVKTRIAAARQATARPEAPVVVAAAIPLPKARPAMATPEPESQPAGGFNLASASSQIVSAPRTPRPAEATSLVAQANAAANSSAMDIINERGYWRGLVEPPPPRPPADIPETRTASAEPPITGSVAAGSLAPWPMPSREPAGDAMAYAPASDAVDNRATPQTRSSAGAPTARRSAPALVKNAAGTKSTRKIAHVKVGERFNDPWMRAMIVAPSALDFMSTSLYGAADVTTLRTYMQKPASTVMMTFSDDPYLGMTFDKFRGNAVVFVATVTFRQRTAALRQD